MKITVVGKPEHKHIYLFSSSNERNVTVNVNHSLHNIFIFLYLVVCSWLFFVYFFFTFRRRIHALQPCWCKRSQFTFYFCSVSNDCVKFTWQLDERTAAERCWISRLELLLLLLLGQRYERPLLLSLQHNISSTNWAGMRCVRHCRTVTAQAGA